MGKGFNNWFGAGFVFGMLSNRGRSSKKDGCYIATAVYGSYDCREVWTLRRFRDYRLKQTAPGRALVRFYYAVSPTLVKWFDGVDWVKQVTRRRLDCLVTELKTKGVLDTPYNDPKTNIYKRGILMARSERQKLKLLYLRDYLLRNTDEHHPVTMKQIIAYLDQNDIQAERKSVYTDIETLRDYGMDIIRESGNYYVGSRHFELPELKLLVDSVQSSKFITYKKTSLLIRKIEEMASLYQAQLLNRQVYVTNRIKSMNESIYYNVDEIHSGIANNKKIRFRYFEYTVTKERSFRKDGKFYEASPYSLTWDDENYYLVAFDSVAELIKHFRVDKMTDISVTDCERDGNDHFESLDMGTYAKKVFGMFSGKEQTVWLRVANHLVGAILDRFGKDISIIPAGEDHFTVSVDVAVSPQFFGWISAFGPDTVITAPVDVVEQMRTHISAINEQYQ